MDHILDIRLKHGLDLDSADPKATAAVASLKSNLSNALRNLSEELYTKTLHFVLEFIQNADDNSYGIGVDPTLEIQMDQRSRIIEVRCNEVGFTPENVTAVCSVGKSTKKNQVGYIGEKGIGFKSVFTIANVVEVISGAYTFKFDKTKELGMIAPIWTPGPRVVARRDWTTFRLHISPRCDLRDLSTKLSDIEPTLLLFLRKLRKLRISVDGVPRQFSRMDGADGITYLDVDNASNRYLTARRSVDTYRHEEKRAHILTSEIVLAFPIDADGKPVVKEQSVHTFLPLRPYGFKFILQADFLTTSSREDILNDREWNTTLRDAVPSLFCDATRALQSHPHLRYDWLQYIPCDSVDQFMLPIVAGIKSIVRLLGRDGLEYRPSELVIAPTDYRTSDGIPLIQDEYLSDLRHLALEYNASRDHAVLQHLGVKQMGSHELICALQQMQRHSQHGFSEQSQEWFEQLSDVLLRIMDPVVYRRRQQYRPYFSEICGLQIVPLADRSWVSANTSDVYFAGTALDDVPRDLPLLIVRQFDRSSSHRRLLGVLGITTAHPSDIVVQIVTKHEGPPRELDYTSLLDHAKFLYKHAPKGNYAALKVRCRDNKIRAASLVYMDSPSGPRDLQPSVFLGPHGAAILHKSYRRNVPADGEPAGWLQWLRTHLRINVSPRILDGVLSPEFSGFVHCAPTSVLLRILHRYQHSLVPSLTNNSRAIQEIADVDVDCLDGVRRPLRDTFVKRAALSRFVDLPFLDIPVPDCESDTWNFLSTFDVTLSLNSAFYLKRLITCSDQAPWDQTEQDVIELYEQLQARFDDDFHQSEIQQAFRHQKLIYVPPTSRYARHHVGSHWVSTEDVHWDGAPVLCSRLILSLSEMYRPLHKLFVVLLAIRPCPDSLLLDEMRTSARIWDHRPLGNEEHELVYDYLKETSDVIRASNSGRGNAPRRPLDWLDPLRDLAIFPALIPSGEVVLCRAIDIYAAFDNRVLEKLFEGAVPLLKAPERQGFSRIKDLLKSRFCEDLRSLGGCVTKKLQYWGDLQLDVLATEGYMARLSYIKRVALGKSGRTSAMTQVQDLIVYEVQKVDCKYILGDVTRVMSSSAAVSMQEERMVLLRCANCRQEEHPTEFARVVAEELGVDITDLTLIFSLEVPEITIRKTLEHKGIPELADLQSENQTTGVRDFESQPQIPSSSVVGPSTRTSAASRRSVQGAHETSDIEANIPMTPALQTELRIFLNDNDLGLRGRININEVLSTNLSSLEGVAALATQRNAVQGRARDSHQQQTTRLDTGTPDQAEFPVGVVHDRSRSPSGHDSQPTAEEYMNGILGERFIYNLFSQELPNFNEDNWTSELRRYIPGFLPYTGRSAADFVYADRTGTLTERIFEGRPQMLERWRGNWPTYYIEVKSTGRAKSTPFFMSRSQLQTALEMTFHDMNNLPANVYVLMRVWNVRSDIRCEAYPDPHKLLYNGGIKIVSDSVAMVLRD